MIKFKRLFTILLLFLLVFSGILNVPVANATTTPSIISLSFTPKDSLVHPTKPIIYLTSPAERKLYAVDYETKQIQSLTFELKPETLAYQNNELYVTFSTANHESGSKGKIVIINTETFKGIDEIAITIDPYEIETRGDNVFIQAASGWFNYSRTTKNQIGSFTYGMKGSSTYVNNFIMHPVVDRFYNLVGSQINAYDFDLHKGVVGSPGANSTNVNRPYVLDHVMISSDGQYIFDNGGTIYDSDLKEISSLGYAVSDATSNPLSKNLYVAAKNQKVINIYDYTYDYDSDLTFRQFKQYAYRTTTGTVTRLHYQNNQVIALTKVAAGDQIEVLPVPPSSESKLNLSSEPYIPIDFSPTDILYHPSEPIVYLTNEFESKVYAVNYETLKISSLSLGKRVKKLAFAQDKLYVSLVTGQRDWSYIEASSVGSVEVIDTKTFTKVANIPLEVEPMDIAVSNDGYLYVIGKGANEDLFSYSLTTKQRVSSINTGSQPRRISYNPYNQKIYLPNGNSTEFSYLVNKGVFGQNPSYSNQLDNAAFSPDGKLVFGGSSVYDSTGNFFSQIGFPLKSIAFDIPNNRLFIQKEDKVVEVYDYAALVNSKQMKKIGQINNLDNVKKIHLWNNQVVSVTQNMKPSYFLNQHYVERLPLSLADSLSITLQIPEKNDDGVAITSPIYLVFNTYILDLGGLSEITLKDSQNNTIPTTKSLYTYSLKIMPQNELKYNESYTLSVPINATEGYDGQRLSAPYTLSFKTDQEVSRLGGYDRYDTSALISKKGWTKSDYAILAYGGDFADALSAAPLAGKYRAPILLTQNDVVPKSIDDEIKRLGVKEIFIVGGTGVISAGVETELKSRSIKVTRLSGQTRYDTAVGVAGHLASSQEVFLVSGENFPDALSIASYAASQQIPILLTSKNSLPSGVKDYIDKNEVKTVYTIGGTGVISDANTSQLPGVERIYGNDRYETNFEVWAKFDFDTSKVYYANGELFPDALSGSALAGLGQHPVILMSNHANQSFIDDLRYNKDLVKNKYILGGQSLCQ